MAMTINELLKNGLDIHALTPIFDFFSTYPYIPETTESKSAPGSLYSQLSTKRSPEVGPAGINEYRLLRRLQHIVNMDTKQGDWTVVAQHCKVPPLRESGYCKSHSQYSVILMAEPGRHLGSHEGKPSRLRA